MSFPLNPAQREAVRCIDTPLLVLAGAGSGKTRVITAKIAHLTASGTPAPKIAAITFTNKAAREMRERTTALMRDAQGAPAEGAPTIATFHALGLSIVRREAKLLGLKSGFSIFDPSDLESVVSELIATSDRGRARAAQWKISQWKNALVAPAAALAGAGDDDERVAALAYARYADALAAYQAVDFDDLIVRPLELFARDAEAGARWSERYAHVLVDEYQDTNPAQYALFRHLVGAHAVFTAVGDDDQAIYGWRGATIENLARLSDDYPRLRVIKLEQNYRSSVRILRSANALIANNPKLHAKKLWSELGTGDTIRVVSCADDEAEAEVVANAISAQRFEQRGRYADFAVLYRGNHQARVIESALRAANVPYVLSGGQSYFERAEIKDIVAYLRLIANDDDGPAFVRAVTTPRRGIGESTLAKLGEVGCAQWREPVRGRVRPGVQCGRAGACARSAAAVLRADQRPAPSRAEGACRPPAGGTRSGDRLRRLSCGHVRQARRAEPLEKRAGLHRLAVAQGRGGRQDAFGADADDRADHAAGRPRGRDRGRRPSVDAACGQGTRVPARIPGRPRGRRAAASRMRRRRQRRRGAAA